LYSFFFRAHDFFGRDIVFNNWLVNPSGNPVSFVEVDLMQEHMNFWIKVSGCNLNLKFLLISFAELLSSTWKCHLLGMASNDCTMC
jgi:hypothetical protein